MYDTIAYEVGNGVAWLTLNRPDKLNAFTDQMNREITLALSEASKDHNVRAIVITGAGRAFCSGEDLGSIGANTDHAEIIRKRYAPMMVKMASVEKPIIAAINGVAAGAGVSLALAADFRLASEKASFIEAFVHIGLVPDSGNMYYLPRLIGLAKALELAILGERVGAQQAKELGLVTDVFKEEEFDQQVRIFAERLAKMPTKAIGLIKRYMYESYNMSLPEMLEKEALAQRTAGLTNDHQEGVQAFIEKRKSVFKGM